MKKNILMLAFMLLTTFTLFAQKSQVFVKSGVAINGYDPVAYFKKNKPVKGDEQFSFKWNEANWLFSSQENLDSFKMNPLKFAPQYGGYCAYGMSEGHKASTEPGAWTIVNEKLYLNYNSKVKTYWNKDQAKRIEDADKKWPELKDKE
ncbi:MAG: YHS domain-containing (seleno)protein [Ferruginibacter sp.]